MGDVLQCLTPLQPAADRPVSSTRPVNVSRVTPDECRVINSFGNSANGRSLGALAQRRSCPPPADPLESKARNRFHAWMSRREQDESTATSRRRTGMCGRADGRSRDVRKDRWTRRWNWRAGCCSRTSQAGRSKHARRWRNSHWATSTAFLSRVRSSHRCRWRRQVNVRYCPPPSDKVAVRDSVASPAERQQTQMMTATEGHPELSGADGLAATKLGRP